MASFALTTARHILRCFQSSQAMPRRSIVPARGYSRWAHRRPARVVNEKEFFGEGESRYVPEDILKNAEFAFAERQKRRPRKSAGEKTETEENEEKGTLNEDGSPVFVKLKKDDPIMSTLMLSVKSRKKQKKDNRILLEGYRLIEDAMKAGLVPEIIIFSRKHELARLPLPAVGVKLYKIPYQTIQLWSDLNTSPGIMGLFQMPDVSEKQPADDAVPVTIICDNVREPGNLGAILRVAAGAGCERVILTKGCVDLWSPKVLRSAAGAHFRLPIYKSQSWPEVQYLISENANVFVADNNVKSSADRAEITNASDSDSDSDSDSNSSSDSESSESEPDEKKGKQDGPFNPKKHQKALYEDPDNLPVIPYFAAEYTKNENIVIVGGETEGISPESVSLALRRDGVRVNVPLTNGVDSLNTGTALGVVLFEIKRQFLSRLTSLK